MHRPPKLLGCSSLPLATSVTSRTISICDFLAPVLQSHPALIPRRARGGDGATRPRTLHAVEALFYKALSRASQCRNRHRSITRGRHPQRPSCQWRRQEHQEATNSIPYSQRRSFHHDSRRLAASATSEAEHHSKKGHRTHNKTGWDFFDSNALDFAKDSRLPLAFFHDLNDLREKAKEHDPLQEPQALLKEQLNLIESVRKLEEKLAKAKTRLSDSLYNTSASQAQVTGTVAPHPIQPDVVLTRDDYKNLVDLYFHTHTSRFDPESPHSSPTPTILEDYAFKLSEDFAPMKAYAEFYDDEAYESPLKEVEAMIKTRKLSEVSAFQAFVDLLLDDHSSNLALFKAYKKLPQPGVAFLPKGTIRVFLQRMSTPWQRNEKSMIRYLSLIDDMQQANLPISQAEWASAIYLAGRSFAKVTNTELGAAMRLWKIMEQEAGVKAHNVTFNILFDIAVRANKFPLAQMILQEMHTRGLQLNRLGRVSIIFYHGLRCDGDAVRKTYRDFVDAGEIVDTLVLNCVMASLYNAQEPAAAEQIYERMKSLHINTRREERSDGSISYYRQYPGPGSSVIDRELAANALGRTLLHAKSLKKLLPEHHKALQEGMPLRPDHITFRTMISYHANVSGDLHRITVLIKEMTEMFGLGMQSIHYQLLFKGFALHGQTRDPHATWSIKRLQAVWDSCRQEIRDEISRRKLSRKAIDPSARQLPSLKLIQEDEPERVQNRPNVHKRLSGWHDFVLDLAAFPRERRKHIERIHAELFDEDQEKREPLLPNPFSSRSAKPSPPQGQEHYYALGDLALDEQEGEYVLPSPILAIDPSSTAFQEPFFPPRTENSEPNADQKAGKDESVADIDSSESFEQDVDEEDKEGEADRPPSPRDSKYQVQATKGLVCWLLRAYDSSTGSRPQVEEIWNSVRKLWQSKQPEDQAAVIRVLRRCLRNCDRYGPPSL